MLIHLVNATPDAYGESGSGVPGIENYWSVVWLRV
jgi:hypothetical protein